MWLEFINDICEYVNMAIPTSLSKHSQVDKLKIQTMVFVLKRLVALSHNRTLNLFFADFISWFFKTPIRLFPRKIFGGGTIILVQIFLKNTQRRGCTVFDPPFFSNLGSARIAPGSEVILK